jgi:arylformamidase
VKVTVEVAGTSWTVDLARPEELAIPLDFEGSQARAFGLPRAQSEPFDAGGFVGDVRRGGSANCEVLTLIPHGNGTHTECVGHITEERIYVADLLLPPLLPAALLTVGLRKLGDVDESYAGEWTAEDRVITAADLESAWEELSEADDFLQAIVVAVDAGDEGYDPLADHSGTNPPYFTSEAIQWLRAVSCEHLLVELPSVDRESDGGSLPNHHDFFGVIPGNPAGEAARRRSITEMITVSEDLDDGVYGLALQIPKIQTDAVPSRPILYALNS